MQIPERRLERGRAPDEPPPVRLWSRGGMHMFLTPISFIFL
jgi:hypothetical protein